MCTQYTLKQNTVYDFVMANILIIRKLCQFIYILYVFPLNFLYIFQSQSNIRRCSEYNLQILQTSDKIVVSDRLDLIGK